MRYLSLGALLCFFLALCSPVYPAQGKYHPKQISPHSLSITRRELKLLKKRQRSLYEKIMGIEKDIKTLQQDMIRREKRLQEMRKKEMELKTKIRATEYSISQRERYVQDLLKLLWKLYLHAHIQDLSSLEMEELTLKQRWISQIYRAYNKEIEEITSQRQRLYSLYSEQRKLTLEMSNSLKEIGRSREGLIKKREEMLRELKKVRALYLAKEKEVEAIINRLERIRHTLNMSTRDIRKIKGEMPWPLSSPGRIIPTHKGLEIEAKKGSEVKAVFQGKVVYEGKLRGFGDVVVLYHGKGYYTLYAYLAATTVARGKMVEKGECIGFAGFCPKLRGWGIYFEVRKGKRTLNPLKWLAPRR